MNSDKTEGKKDDPGKKHALSNNYGGKSAFISFSVSCRLSRGFDDLLDDVLDLIPISSINTRHGGLEIFLDIVQHLELFLV